jgi:hypothetical protein
VIVAAAVCPHPPLLFRELNGAEDAVAPLRAVCLDTVRDVVDAAERVVLVGGADTGRVWEPSAGQRAGEFGGPGPRAEDPDLPLSLRVGRRLLDEVGWQGPVDPLSVPWDASGEDVRAIAADLVGRPERLGVIALGDGSARRGPTAPGFIDERAFPFDDGLAAALERGDARALLELDHRLAAELMVLGRAAFAVLGALAVLQLGESDGLKPELRYRDDPFGVSYFVARWSFPELSERTAPLTA